jgi:hypothetical protein
MVEIGIKSFGLLLRTEHKIATGPPKVASGVLPNHRGIVFRRSVMRDKSGLDVFVRRDWGRRRILPSGPGAQHLEEICVANVGHAWDKLPEFPGQPTLYFVQDFLLDQSGLSGHGALGVAKLSETVKFDLTLNSSYGYRLGPALCQGNSKSIKVTLPSDAIGNVYFSAYLGRQVTTGLKGGSFMPGTGSVSWLNLAGTTPPNISYDNFSISQRDNSALIFEVEGEVTETFQFGALFLEGHYPHRSFDPGQKSYYPLSYAVPFGVGELPPSMPPDSETFVLFGYTYKPSTAVPADPGPFVSIA